MRLSVIAVGTRMPRWVQEGVEEYGKRLPRELKLEWREIPVARRGGDSTPAQLREREGAAILKAVTKGDRVIALEVGGRRLSTEALAGHLRDWQMRGDNVSFLVGGPASGSGSLFMTLGRIFCSQI